MLRRLDQAARSAELSDHIFNFFSPLAMEKGLMADLISALEEESLAPDYTRHHDDAPGSFRYKLLLLTRVARSRHNAGWHSMADKLRVKLRDVIRESDLSAAEQSELLIALVSISYRPFVADTGAEPDALMADDYDPFAAAVAAALSPTVSDAMICPRPADTPPDSLVPPSYDTDVDSVSYGPFEDEAGTELPIVNVDADLSLPVVTYCGCAPAVAIEQCVLLPAMSDESSTVHTDQEAVLELLVAAACPEGASQEAAFWLLIFELEEWCGFNTSAAVSARDQAAAECVSVKEAAVPGVDRFERTELSPSVDPYHVGPTESPPKVGNAALASGISGPPVHTEQRSVAVFEQHGFSPTVDLSPRHGERTEFSPRVKREQEEHMGEQSIGMASDSAVDSTIIV